MGRRKIPDFKYCGKCKQRLPTKENFYKRKTAKDGFDYTCKNCRGYKSKIIHKKGNTILCLKCKEYKAKKEFNGSSKNAHRCFKERMCKECKNKQYLKRKETNGRCQTLDRALCERFCGMRDRAKKKGYSLNFDVSYLKKLWFKQKGLCAISGIPMTYIMFKGRTPTNISVDRKDSNKKYIKQNIQLVCMAVNQMKSDLSNENLLYFCNKIIENYAK